MSNALTSAIGVAQRTIAPARLRAVDYLRVSTAEQRKGYGIAYTGKKTVRHIEKKNWEHVNTYADEGYSGSLDHTQRPDLKRLMADAKQTPRPFDVVVVSEERAIGRRDRAFWPWVWVLEDLGIFVAVVRGDYDNTTEEGRSKMRKEQDKAEDERITIRDRTQGGVQEKAEIGGHPGGVAPYPYRIENKGIKGESRIVLDKGDERAPYSLMHRAYEHIVDEGMNCSEVEDLFNAEKIHGPTLDYWPRGSLRHVLTSQAVQTASRTYRDPKQPKVRLNDDGEPIFGETVVIEYEPVFNDIQLKKLNKALERTSRKGRKAEEYSVHPLSEHLFGVCENYYTGVRRTGRAGVRAYRCTGTVKDYKNPKKAKCECSQVDADALEYVVWHHVCKLLEEPDRLMALSSEWAEIARANEIDYASRVQDLENQIEEIDDLIDLTTDAATRQAVRKKLSRAEARQYIESRIKAHNEEREQLVELRDQAISWREEVDRAQERAVDLDNLARMARTSLYSMTPEQKADVIDWLELKVTITGEIPRKTRSDDLIGAWFRDRERLVPLLTDEAWAAVEPILAARKGRKPKDPRGLLDSMLHKARTGCSWMSAPVPGAQSIWGRWLHQGLWEALMDALATFPGTAPVSEVAPLPSLRVEGRVDPRLFVGDDESSTEDALFKASDYKISPFELESALLEHEAVAEAAVVPAPDALRLAVPKAYVVLAEGWEPGPDTAKELFAHSRAVLAPYKRIRRIEFAELPKTISGKIRRIELRERTAAGSENEYAEDTTGDAKGDAR